MAISRHRQADTSAFFFQRLSGGFTHSAFHIEMTDETRNARSPGFERRTFSNGRQIGNIYFDKAVASYLGDFVIHFNHPTWRDDQNSHTRRRTLRRPWAVSPAGMLRVWQLATWKP